MGLFQRAVETFDNMEHLVAQPRDETEAPLVPVSHTYLRAQIEVVIDRDGNFIRAAEVEKEKQKTIIPATEKSAGRTSGVAPYPFSDQLEYLLPDNAKKHAAYLEALDAWADSGYAHEKVRAVQALIHSETLGQKLAEAGIIKLKEDGSLASGKITDTDYKKCFVRWVVLNTGDKDAAWEDLSLINAYILYYQAMNADRERRRCMITGEEDFITFNNPKGVCPTASGAKLISSNDTTDLTFRGRYENESQALSIGYTASQKAHNAIRWLLQNFGFRVDSRMFVCWNPKGLKTHRINDPFQPETEEPLDPAAYQKELEKAICGLRDNLPDNESVIICAFDAATTGRLSLVYYNELLASDFHKRLADWYGSCCWENWQFGIQSPSVRRIALFAFGTERGSGRVEADAKLMSSQIQRLISCVYDHAQIPYDIVQALTRRASNPLSFKGANNSSNYRSLLFTACAVIRKYWNDKLNKEEWPMAFEPKKKDRSYQFGCLLAVMEKVERDTYGSGEIKRETNAARMQVAFCERPLHTAHLLNQKLQPYFEKISPASRAFYKHRLGEITEILSEYSEAELNKPLRETYLLGYYLQRNALYTSNKNKENKEEN